MKKDLAKVYGINYYTCMTATDTAKAIRQSLKKNLNLSMKKVGVKVGAGYGSVNVVIKSEEAQEKLEQIQKLVRGFESVDRCPDTLEILSGGNLFIFVKNERGTLL